MKIFLFLGFAFSAASASFAQSVSITADGSKADASAMLDIKSTSKGMLIPRMKTTQRTGIGSPAKGLLVFDTDTNSFWFYNGTLWTDLSSGSAGYWSLNGVHIFNSNTGNVGIGTSIPAEKLTVQTTNNTYGISQRGEGGNIIATYIGGTSAGIGTFSHTNMRLFSNGISRVLIAEATGNIGIGTDNPTSKLQIGAVPGYAGYDLAIGNGTQAMVFQQNGGFSNWQSNTNISLLPNNGTGYVGINTTTPTNKFQIGSVGPAGFSGNDFAIGNGSNAVVVSQYNTSTNIASTTDIALLPKYGTGGRVGINTATPRAALEVAGYGEVYQTYDYINGGGSKNGVLRCELCIAGVSIYANRGVMAQEFDAFSDARIKNPVDISNSTKDLAIINALQITDYTMKDKVKYGDRIFKKVIAQEVEKVYPQVVSKHTDFVPNVYQLSDKITKTDDGYLISFSKEHHISRNAKKLQVLLDDNKGMQPVDIISLPSAHEVMIRTGELNGSKMFVYGEEVDDFRTVDYEGLTTLNISATQELSRIVVKQAKQIALLTAALRRIESGKQQFKNKPLQ